MEETEKATDEAEIVVAVPPDEFGTAKKTITIIACILVQVCAGILYLWSIFNSKVQSYYGWEKSAANLVSSFMLFGFVLGNLIGGFVRDKTNPRLTAFIGCIVFSFGILLTSLLTKSTIGLIYLTYSAIAGIGCGFIYGSILGCLIKLFPTKRGFASGVSVAAFAASTVVFAPLVTVMLENLTVPETFRYLGLGFLGITLIACAFIRLPKLIASASSKTIEGLTPAQAVKKGAFWCIFAFSFFINATWNMLLPIIKPLGEERSLSAAAAAVVVMITGIANATGRLSVASASDKFGRGKLLIAMAIITFICAITLIWAQTYLYLIAIVAAAFCFGGPSGVLPAMTIDTSGAKYNGTNYGIVLLSLGFSSVIFTLISNALYSKTGSYTASFIVAAVTCVIAVLVVLLYQKLSKKPLPKEEIQAVDADTDTDA